MTDYTKGGNPSLTHTKEQSCCCCRYAHAKVEQVEVERDTAIQNVLAETEGARIIKAVLEAEAIEARRFYQADGTFTEFETAEEVKQLRIAAAVENKQLRDSLGFGECPECFSEVKPMCSECGWTGPP